MINSIRLWMAKKLIGNLPYRNLNIENSLRDQRDGYIRKFVESEKKVLYLTTQRSKDMDRVRSDKNGFCLLNIDDLDGLIYEIKEVLNAIGEPVNKGFYGTAGGGIISGLSWAYDMLDANRRYLERIRENLE